MEQIQIQSFGFSELYEWFEPQPNALGKFVTFSSDAPNKIVLFGKNANDFCLGITTINSTLDSDNPKEWHSKYKKNHLGDLFLEKERLAVGTKVYDENMEMSFIRTYPWEHLIPIVANEFDSSKNYVNRVNRQEWIRVNIAGKAIVIDNGTCKPGSFCTPYVGEDTTLFGTAVPATSDNMNKFYVLERISDTTILILNK
jgi:hypothetical protein